MPVPKTGALPLGDAPVERDIGQVAWYAPMPDALRQHAKPGTNTHRAHRNESIASPREGCQFGFTGYRRARGRLNSHARFARLYPPDAAIRRIPKFQNMGALSMVFGSTVFLFLFLPLVLLGCVALRKELQNLWLLAVSLLFYAWGEPVYVPLLLCSIAGNYVLGLLIQAAGDRSGRAKMLVALAVLFNLGLLGWFKYANFFVNSLNPVLESIGWSSMALDAISLPLGISFFTFQAISYVVDVYRRDTEAQKNPLHVGLYLSIFPRTAAGPIVRFQDIASELKHREITLDNLDWGIRRFIMGLAKKVLIADVLAAPVAQIFDQIPPEQLTPGLAWLGIVLYTLQIYYDFSGYTDMAIGVARMLGFHFPENFQHPYISQSITEFWRRWHISLSSWFRDYLYIPLGGNRVRPWRNYLNLMMVFLLCGLWHGASWTFVGWGLYHGFFLVAERFLGRNLGWSVPRPLRHGYAIVVVMAGWVFFRAPNVAVAWGMLKAMAGLAPGDGAIYYPALYLNLETLAALCAGVVFAAPIFTGLGWLDEKGRPRFSAAQARHLMPEIAVVLALLTLFLFSIVRMTASSYSPFIYVGF